MQFMLIGVEQVVNFDHVEQPSQNVNNVNDANDRAVKGTSTETEPLDLVDEIVED
jgi:hypothetical protein